MLGSTGGLTDWEHLGRQGAHRKLIRAADADKPPKQSLPRNRDAVAVGQQVGSPPNTVAESSCIRAALVSTSSGIRRHFLQAFSHEGNMTPKNRSAVT
jgi:hypothetical protein